MFTLRRNVTVLAVALAGVVLCASPAVASVSFDFFYSNLSPHGNWMVSGSYGRVWQPTVYRPGWNPYYDGHWVETDLGNTWVSDYPWGDVPYHYGTWVMDPGMGWVWVPGYTWAPAWVVFRTGPDCIGWAPVSPRFQIGLTIGPDDYPPGGFVYVPSRAFLDPRVRTVVVPPSRTKVIMNKTKIVDRSITVENNVVVNRGLTVNELQRSTGKPIHPVPIERCPRLGPKVKRDEIRIGPEQRLDGLRAAQPVSPRVRPKEIPTETAQASHGRNTGPGPAPTRASSSTPMDSGARRHVTHSPVERGPSASSGSAPNGHGSAATAGPEVGTGSGGGSRNRSTASAEAKGKDSGKGKGNGQESGTAGADGRTR